MRTLYWLWQMETEGNDGDKGASRFHEMLAWGTETQVEDKMGGSGCNRRMDWRVCTSNGNE